MSYHLYARNGEPPRKGRPRTRGNVLTFTDAGIKEDYVVHRSYPGVPIGEDDWCYLEGSGPWDWEGYQEPVIRRVCPVCKGRLLRRTEYCARCDRAGADGLVTYPGLAIDSAPDPTYPTQGTKYQPGRLRGGR